MTEMSKTAKRIERMRHLNYRAYQLAHDLIIACDDGPQPEQLGTLYDEAMAIVDEWEAISAEIEAAEEADNDF